MAKLIAGQLANKLTNLWAGNKEEQTIGTLEIVPRSVEITLVDLNLCSKEPDKIIDMLIYGKGISDDDPNFLPMVAACHKIVLNEEHRKECAAAAKDAKAAQASALSVAKVNGQTFNIAVNGMCQATEAINDGFDAVNKYLPRVGPRVRTLAREAVAAGAKAS